MAVQSKKIFIITKWFYQNDLFNLKIILNILSLDEHTHTHTEFVY